MTHRDESPRIPSDAVEAAAGALSAGDPLAHLFCEEREDRRLRVTDDGSRECVRTRTRGAAAVGRTSVHLSEPRADELLALARAASEGTPPPEPSGAGDTPDEPSTESPGLDLESISQWLSRKSIPESSSLDVRLIEHHQYIWVCRPGEKPRSDSRKGRRLEVRATWRSGAKRGLAVEEKVLRPGESLPEGLAELAIERARRRATESRPPHDQWAEVVAVFDSGTAGVVVHELIGHALEGDVVASCGSSPSPLAGTPLPRFLRVIDDPRRGRTSWTIDDEGTPSTAVTLVEEGSVAGIVHDRMSGLVMGSASNGHGRRASYLDRVLPRLGCTFIDRGTSAPASILEDTACGLFIRRIVAADAIPSSGVATFLVADADVIERGRLGPALEPFTVFIDLGRSLASIDAIGDDLAFDRCVGSCVRDGQPVAVSVGAPTIRLRVIKAQV